jgi:hypothetical protein
MRLLTRGDCRMRAGERKKQGRVACSAVSVLCLEPWRASLIFVIGHMECGNKSNLSTRRY